MSFATRALGFAACVLSCALGPAYACAQEDPTERARRILGESQAHHEAGREALAAEGYLQLYEALREIGRTGAPIALWNAGNALAEVHGRERDAITTLRRFLDESTVLTDEPQVVTWRSTAVGLIAELEARQGDDAQALDRPSSQPSTAREQATAERTAEHDGSVSPVGPVILGVGGAALLAGLVVAAVGLTQDQELTERCPGRVRCDEAMRADVDATRSLGIAGDALWVAGATVALLGLVLTLTIDDGESERAAVQLRGVPGGGFATLRGSFQ